MAGLSFTIKTSMFGPDWRSAGRQISVDGQLNRMRPAGGIVLFDGRGSMVAGGAR
jgi:hypothetical protein